MVNWNPQSASFSECFCKRYLIFGAAAPDSWRVTLCIQVSDDSYQHYHEGKKYKEVFAANGRSLSFKDALNEATRLATQTIEAYERSYGNEEEKLGNLSLIDDLSGNLSIVDKIKKKLSE